MKPYRPWYSSGPSHHDVAARTAAVHQAARRPPAPPGRVRMYTPAGTMAARVETALTPPMHATTRPERAAALQSGPERVSGSTAHGASTPGSTPAEVEPTRMVKVGHSANAAPARSRVARDPMPTASASLTVPEHHHDQQRHPHPLATTGTCSRLRDVVGQDSESVADAAGPAGRQPVQRVPQYHDLRLRNSTDRGCAPSFVDVVQAQVEIVAMRARARTRARYIASAGRPARRLRPSRAGAAGAAASPSEEPG